MTVEEKRETEVCMRSDPVSEAGVPPVSVASMQKSLLHYAGLQGLKESKTFTVIDKLPEDERAVGSRWEFVYKQVKEGMTVKTKARLVAQGFMQKGGVDFY